MSGIETLTLKDLLKILEEELPYDFDIINEWENWAVEKLRIKLCKLYYPPYNFDRTGCVGCPMSLYIQKELETLKELLPEEYEKAYDIFGAVIGYRIKNI